MISSDDSPSSPVLETLRRSSRLSNIHSPTHPAVAAGPPSEANPSNTLSPPKKPRAASKVAINGSHLRKRTPPDKSHQASCHSKLQKELFKHSSIPPVPRRISMSPKTNFSPQCSSKVLKRPRKQRSKKGSSLSDLSQCPNGSTGTLSDSLAKELGGETQQTDTIIETVQASTTCAKKHLLPTDNLTGTLTKRTKRTKTKNKSESKAPSPPHQCTGGRTYNLKSSDSRLPSTPRRDGRNLSQPQEPRLSSTPDCGSATDHPFSISLSPLGSKREEFPDDAPFSERKVFGLNPLEKTAESEVAAPRGRPRGRPRGTRCRSKMQAVKKTLDAGSKKRKQAQSDGGPPATKRRRGRKKEGGTQENATRQACRPRFQPLSESPDQVRLNPDETTLSSDLSIELSVQEDHLTSLSPMEDEEEDEEELPSFLIQKDKKPLSITEGICVWCKFRNYPFWPAVVKSVNRRLKKASIVFVDDLLFDKKRIRKGFSVALKTLKRFDCEEADQLVCKAREKYDGAIKWCLELIADYRIRIGCGSFTGSFIEYFSDDISCPVRRKYPQGSALTFPSKLIMDHYEEEEEEEQQEEEVEEEEEEEQSAKKLLPDRSKAARNRANDKLVHFIIKQRKVEKRLLAVISGQQQSKWLRSFLKASRRVVVVDTYLEDEQQLDQVYLYLRGVFSQAPHTAPCLADVDLIRFVLDVLLPEAIIHAIAGVDKVSLEKAEDKYLKGPCLSKREREEFDLMIEQQMRRKAMRHRFLHTEDHMADGE